MSKTLGEYLLIDWESQSKEEKRFYIWNKQNTWVEDYSIFMALKEEFKMFPSEWPLEFKQEKYL